MGKSIVGVLAAACGGPATPGVASLSGHSMCSSHATSTSSSGTGTGTRSSGTKRQIGIKFAKCMRRHGVGAFPERPTGQIGPGGGIDPNSPTFQAAQKACSSLLPKPSPAQIERIKKNALEFAKCMRSHGVTNFPDPQGSATGDGIGIRIGGPANGTLNPTSPTFQSAQKTCSKYFHLLKGGPKHAVGAP
jgi:hypothetical protein